MSLRSLANQTVQLVPRVPGTDDDYGNDSYTDGTPVNEKGWVEQTAATEVTEGGEVQTSDWLLVLVNPAAAITSRSKVIANGLTYEVIGSPSRPRDRFREHHAEARLRYVSG